MHSDLCSFSQTDLSFGEDFKRAVERKQVAQQDAEKARFLVEKVIMQVWSNSSVYELSKIFPIDHGAGSCVLFLNWWYADTVWSAKL